MKKKITNAIWVMGVLSIAVFCLSACVTRSNGRDDLKMHAISSVIFNPTVMEKLKMDNGVIFKPNDRYPLTKEEFRLYYTSASTDQQTIDVYVEDNFGQKAKLSFLSSTVKGTRKRRRKMRLRSKLIVFCLVCLSCLRLSDQDGRNLLLSLPPFECAVICIRHFEGLHGKGYYPYVGYGHKLQKGEHFTVAMTERQADSLLRADLLKRLMIFKDYGKNALLLAVLSYNVGTGRLLGYGKHPKSRLLRKIESGDRNFYREFVSFCRYKGKVLRGLVKWRKVEFALFYVP